MTLSRIHAASLSVAVILLLCMVSAAVVPVVEPPVVLSPVLDVSPAPRSTLQQSATPGEPDPGKWEMISGSSYLSALSAGGGGSFVGTAGPGAGRTGMPGG